MVAMHGIHLKSALVKQQSQFRQEEIAQFVPGNQPADDTIAINFVINPVNIQQLRRPIQPADRLQHDQMPAVGVEEIALPGQGVVIFVSVGGRGIGQVNDERAIRSQASTQVCQQRQL